MSKQIKAKSAQRERPSAHEVMLAGIGAVSLARKNAGSAVAEAIAIAGRVPAATGVMIDELTYSGGRYRDELIERASGLGKRATAAAGGVVSNIESRLQPLLRRFEDATVGLGIIVRKPKAKRAPAKRARKATKTVAKRKVRKAA